MKFLLLILVSLLLLGSCSESGSNKKNHNHNSDKEHINDHMNKRSFEDLVSAFDDPERGVWQKPGEVINFMGDIKGETILDIGCGTGYFAFPLADSGATVICADVDDRFLDFVEKKKTERGIEAGKLSTKKVPYDSPGQYEKGIDKVIIVDTYHHIDNRSEYFKKVKGILNKGGLVYIVDFKKNADMDFGPPSDHRISANKVAEEMIAAGFKNHSINMTMLPYQYIVCMAVRD